MRNRKLLDYEGRLFTIEDGARGWVWQDGQWQVITAEFAGRVFAQGSAPDRPLEKHYGITSDVAPDPVAH